MSDLGPMRTIPRGDRMNLDRLYALAACRNRPDWFDLDHRHPPIRDRQVGERLAVCFACPVLADCREWSPTQYWDGAVTAGQYIPPRSGRHTEAGAIALVEGAA